MTPQYHAPLVLITWKDGTLGVCLEYRALYTIFEGRYYPLPDNITILIAELKVIRLRLRKIVQRLCFQV